jgi:hypothetical protein
VTFGSAINSDGLRLCNQEHSVDSICERIFAFSCQTHAEVSAVDAVSPAAGAAKKKDKLLTMDSSEITYEMVAKKLRDIVTSRGRKGTDKQEQVRRHQAIRLCGSSNAGQQRGRQQHG